MMPGGTLQEGESYEQAALRELWEETGLAGVTLGPCAWTRRHVWHMGDVAYDSIERYYLVRTKRFDGAPARPTPIEAEAMKEQRWWSARDIIDASGRETFVPRRLGKLLQALVAGDIPSTPIDAGI